MKHDDEFQKRTDLVKIPASALKWVSQPGLKFVLYGLEVCTFDRLNTEGYVQGFTTNGGGCVHLSDIHETILVVPEEYEKEAIATITGMLLLDKYISSKIIKVAGVVFFSYSLPGELKMTASFVINADPRPWEDQYTIVIDEVQ